MNRSNQLRRLVCLLIFIDIAIPHPSHSQSKLYNHKSTHLSSLLLGCWWLSSCRWLCHCGEVKMFALSDVSCFYGLRNSRRFGILIQILWETGTELFKICDTRTLQGNWGKWDACCRGIYVEIMGNQPKHQVLWL